MDPRDTILLCLVFCLSQKIQAQEGDFPVPIISATPGSVIPWNDSVKILCWGTPESYLYQLEILGNSTFEVVEKKLGFQKKAEFLIKHMNPNTAGRYQCQYRKQDHWSEHSKALELVVTGFYNKPFFSADQGIVVMLGKNISLQCRSAHIPFDRFSLIKEGGATLSQNQNGRHQGTFILGPVNQSFSGNYRCYDIMKQDYTVGNLIRMGVAGLVLVALLAILVKNWHNHQAPNKEDCPDLSELSWSKQKCQT
ncbi:immunoglobulin alpha Fc receptor isoform X3 [Mirounga angustirostris]|uniref:immunoglobulin alpha Fc receptor isoform X3 n=1 Tax=Mirounga angustirostris TaxID=9716 RepID=UPI0023E43370|nr:immunoglobulin alpha Fc receptor-like isoform X3 [Mirounga angustirostris]